MNRNILVCGGTGKRGRNFCQQLLKEGNKVTCIDDESVGWIVEIADCLDNPNFTFIRSKIEDVELFDFKEKFHLIYDYIPNTSTVRAKDKIRCIANAHHCRIIKKLDKKIERNMER